MVGVAVAVAVAVAEAVAEGTADDTADGVVLAAAALVRSAVSTCAWPQPATTARAATTTAEERAARNRDVHMRMDSPPVAAMLTAGQGLGSGYEQERERRRQHPRRRRRAGRDQRRAAARGPAAHG